jgi:hypothetical protein
MSERTKEEIDAALAAKDTEIATAKAQAEAVAAEREALALENAKLKAKELNFGKLRKKVDEMTEDERNALTEKELELQKRAEELEASQTTFQKTVKDEWRSNAIQRLSGGDAAKAKEIEAAMAEVVGSDSDRASVEAHVLKAAKLARKDAAPDPLLSAFGGFSGTAPEKADAKPERTVQGAALAKMMGLKD